MRNATIISIICVALLVAPAAMAQATRTWVSGVGDDVNPCSRTAPCKTFAGAISKTAAGGEIDIIDSGAYGTLTITKSITIDGNGQHAGVLASLTNGFIVNAGINDKVIIRNVSVNGANSGINGIRYLAGGQVTLENVNFFGFNSSATSRAIDVSLTNSGKLFVRNCSLNNNQNGIRATTTAGQLLLLVENTSIVNNALIGVELAGGDTRATIYDTIIANNLSDGLKLSGGLTLANVDRSVITFNNGNGINASVSGARVRVNDTTIVNNLAGITIAAGATVESAGNNRVNGTSTIPNATYTLQ